MLALALSLGASLSGIGQESVSTRPPLRFSGVEVSSAAVSGEIDWFGTDEIPGATVIDFFASEIVPNRSWRWLGLVAVPHAVTNFPWAFPFSISGTTNRPSALFLMARERSTNAATMRDSDGDTLPDIYERANGTNPWVPDYDSMPMLMVGPTREYPTLQDALEASVEYSVIALPEGEVTELQLGVTMPLHPVMIIGGTNGYAHVRSRGNPYVFALRAGQSEETIFQNIYLELLPSSNLQVGFWMGADPWDASGPTRPSSATFRNVYLRARGCSRTGYGWLIRRWQASPVTIDRCVVNAAGSQGFQGVVAADAPNLLVKNTTFLNFPSDTGTSYGAAIQVETWGSGSLPTQVVITNCVFDESFISAYPLVRMGGGDHVTMANVVLPPGHESTFLPDESDMVTLATNCVSWSGYAIPDSAADVLGIGALAVVGDVTRDSDLDGITDWLEAYQYGIDPNLKDTDGDGIDDMDELNHGANPTNSNIYCFALTVAATNEYSVGRSLKMAMYDSTTSNLVSAIHESTNRIVEEVFHCVVSGEKPILRAWFDLADDFVEVPYSIKGHSNKISVDDRTIMRICDTDGDGMPDWWELQYELDPQSADDAYLDADNDGLLNLHEYWCWTSPTNAVENGVGTALAAMSKSIDDRIKNRPEDESAKVYDPLSVAGMHTPNTNCWAYGIDFSCASPYNSRMFGWQAGTLISPRHLLQAAHYASQTNTMFYFRGTDGNVYSATSVSTNSIPNTDIVVVLLDHELTNAVSVAKILPADYEGYIRTGRGLPMLMFNHAEEAIVADSADLRPDVAMANGRRPLVQFRERYFKGVVSGDSGNPKFFVVGEAVVFVCNVYSYGIGDSGVGPFTTHYKREIQQAMDELAPGYEIQEFDFSSFRKLPGEGVVDE